MELTLPTNFHFVDSLDIFQVYYINKYIKAPHSDFYQSEYVRTVSERAILI